MSVVFSRFGHLSEQIFRACRLVVDTGLHALDWSQEQALDFMLSHTAASQESLQSEITRYVTWPGQATAYKVATLLDAGTLIKVQIFFNHFIFIFSGRERWSLYKDQVIFLTGELKVGRSGFLDE